jgi:hypothetical protein
MAKTEERRFIERRLTEERLTEERETETNGVVAQVIAEVKNSKLKKIGRTPRLKKEKG